jgi:hypothetical protein
MRSILLLRRSSELLILALCVLSNVPYSAKAGADSPTLGPASDQVGTRYGPFGWLDKRSQYGQGSFPEPFIVDDSDLEINEARLDWLHTKIGAQHSDIVTGEIEKGFGPVTLEIEVPYERDLAGGVRTEGFNNIDLGIRTPVFQYVSADDFIDSTFGIAFEAGVPTHSTLSKNAELVPKIFNDLRLGDHFTMQSIFGYSMLLGPGDDGGLQTFEYGFVFGYSIPHKELPLPDILQLIPMFELSGETGLDKGSRGDTTLEGNVGLRANLKPIGNIQPRVGVGYVFPIDKGARQDLHWGVITSLVFEY